MISRAIEKDLLKCLSDNKIIILLGPRQVGKTFLLNKITLNKEEVLWLNGDDTDTRDWLGNPNAVKLKGLIGAKKILVIDEAQRIENIGLCLKIIHDQLKDVKVLATGSSSFELANRINEPLTGRKWEFNLYPFSFSEMANNSSLIEESRMLENRMIYGYYPEIVNNTDSAVDRLKQLAGSYLYKDILTWERIQKPDKMERLLQALAFQIGNQVSYHELATTCGLNSETVEHYINLLEKAFIIYRLGTYSRNLRNELKKTRKIYFYDNGIRNAVINQFSPLNLRNDVGALWENFLITERLKNNRYRKNYVNTFFWRTKTQQEIDYIEEKNGKVYAFEFKWNTKNKTRFPAAFTEAYDPETKVISPENYTDFIL